MERNTSTVVLICILVGLSIPVKVSSNQATALWVKINQFPVCLYARGRRPGMLTYVGDGKLVGAMKLVYVKGSVRCAQNVAYDSRWGCYQHPSYEKFPLNVVVTDGNDNLVYPVERYVRNTGLWYYLPFTDAKHSDEIVFTDYANPFIPKYATIKIWYGEDLKSSNNNDNGGRVCVDVWAHLM